MKENKDAIKKSGNADILNFFMRHFLLWIILSAGYMFLPRRRIETITDVYVIKF